MLGQNIKKRDNLMNIKFLILCLSSSQPRRQKLIQNLLLGKRTVSTLFWGMRYGLLKYSAILKNFNLDKMPAQLNKLIQKGYVEQVDEYKYILTTKGQKEKDSILESFYILKTKLNYFDYDVITFKARLLLAIQVASEYSYKNSNYYPVTNDFKSASLVKTWFKAHKNALPERMKEYLTNYLSSIDEGRANIFAQMFVGYHRYGMTNQQIANEMDFSLLEEYLFQYDLLVDFIEFIIHDDDELLKELLVDIKALRTNKHALNTYNEFKHGQAIQEIAENNKLRNSTIREHLLECAIWMPKNEFPYGLIINEEKENALNQYYQDNNIDDWQYKENIGNQEFSFFEFRIYQIMRSKPND